MPIDESAMRRTEDRHRRAVRRRQNPVAAGLLPQVFAEPVEELARGVRPALERQHERGDPLVVVDELLLAGVGVVDAIDVIGLQQRIVFTRRSDVVVAAARLVQIVVEVGAGRDQAVDIPMLDEMRDDEPQPAGARARRPGRERSCSRPPASSPRCAARSPGCAPGKRSFSIRGEQLVGATRPASTANGSTGTRRKRLFSDMLCQL